MNELDGRSVLVAHCGARKIKREELREIPAPAGTKTHQPLAHIEIVERLEETLSFRYLKIKREEYAVSRDGMRMFGVMDLDYGFAGCGYSIGLRNSNDKSMRLALTAGYRVFVCDNMAFSGDFAPLLQKHTGNFDLADLISVAVDRIHRSFEPLKEQIKRWQNLEISDSAAKLIIYEAFLDGRVKLPRALLAVVHETYFKPEHEAFRDRTLWSLSNAFTSSFQRLKPVQQFAATARLGTYLGEVDAPMKMKPDDLLHPRRLDPIYEEQFNEEDESYFSDEDLDVFAPEYSEETDDFDPSYPENEDLTEERLIKAA
jgi:hypothetical protein